MNYIGLSKHESVIAVVPDTYSAPTALNHAIVVHVRDTTTGDVRSVPIMNDERSEVLTKIHAALEELHDVAVAEVLKNHTYVRTEKKE